MYDHSNSIPTPRPPLTARRRLDPVVAVLVGCMAGIILTLGAWVAVAVSSGAAADTPPAVVEVERTGPEAKPEPEEVAETQAETAETETPAESEVPVEPGGETETGEEGETEGEIEDERDAPPVAEVDDEPIEEPGHDHDDAHDHAMDEVEDWLNAPPQAWAPVVGDELDLRFVAPEHVEPMLEIWNRFVQLIPAEQRTMVTSFELAAGHETGAYVYPDPFDRSMWTLGVSTGLDPDLDLFLVHEFAHLLTLNADVTVPAWTADECGETYFVGDACVVDGSILDEFVDRFWEPADVEEISGYYVNGEWDEIDDFYAENADEFVSSYAATNPMEDLAETFMVFVLYEPPVFDAVADQKIEWLWEDPAMVALRDAILAQV